MRAAAIFFVPLPFWLFGFSTAGGCCCSRSFFVAGGCRCRAETDGDFRRWRAAWLSYHLKLFGRIRAFSALVLLSVVLMKGLIGQSGHDPASRLWARWGVSLLYICHTCAGESQMVAWNGK